jgi:2-polyprenyl-6-methoxyphenol hydroxylase-like FAD-dependent oxidoreductase
MAIEDGVTLPHFLKGVNPRDTAALTHRLERFTAFRYKKTREVVLQSRWFGAIAQWENPLLCAGRDAVMRAVAPWSMRLSARRIGTFTEPS